MRVFLYDAGRDAEQWDMFVNASHNGTFLQSRRFLSYHGDRFEDFSVIVRNEKQQIIGVMPAARDKADPSLVVSHPGITYGGLVCSGRPGADEVYEMLQSVLGWYRDNGFRSLLYKAVPWHLHAVPFHSDLYALWRLGARTGRRDLWNIITLDGGRSLSKGRKWAVNKARASGLDIRVDGSDDAYRVFFGVLEECLAGRYGVRPVHTLDDLLTLRSLLPGSMDLWLAADESGCLGGTWIFKMGKAAWHTQYIASTERGRDRFAVDLLLESVIRSAEQQGIRYFSFGASTEQNGQALNSGLFDFKAGFGAGSVAQDFYHIDLE
ncbi:MAG: GNAT family N-acetyltransferase [Nitrospiraceae bacterium]|nr:GNAT family N-acetyltransferase [Nitrospiraceae bacterium]